MEYVAIINSCFENNCCFLEPVLYKTSYFKKMGFAGCYQRIAGATRNKFTTQAIEKTATIGFATTPSQFLAPLPG